MLVNKASAPAALGKPPLAELAKPSASQTQNGEQPPRTSPRTSAGQASVDELLTLTATEATALDGELNGSEAGELLQPQSAAAAATGTGPKKAPPPVPPKPSVSSGHTPENQTRLRHLQMAGEALLNVVQANAGLELQFIGRFKMFFTLFTVVPDGFAKPDLFSLNAALPQGANKSATATSSASETPAPSPLAVICSKLLQNASELLHAVISNQDCVNDIAASRVMHHLLLALELFPSGNERLLDCLHALCSNTQIIKELVYKGTYILSKINS